GTGRRAAKLSFRSPTLMACRKRAQRALQIHSECAKRARKGPSSKLFTDSTEENFLCHYGDVVVSERSRFTLLEGLGSGAFGQVVRCSANSGDQVALKILKHKDFCAEVSLEAEEEARILKELQHPHIVRMLDFFEFQGHLCIALELLGRNLYEVLVDNGTLSIKLVKDVTRQVLLALTYLEKLQVIHGDLKPENVLMVESPWGGIAEKPHFKVIDFGGARRVGDADEIVIQTLPYRAPEVLLGLPVCCVADMWSLGCISIELFVGEPVFPHTGDKDDILQGMVQLIGNIPPHMLDQGSKTSEFFERVREHKASGSRRRGARGRFFLFQWASALREALDALRPRAKDAPVVYKLRRQSLTRSPPSLLGDWRARRYDLERRRWLGVPRRLRGSRLRGQLLLRRQLEQLVKRMLVLDPARRMTAFEALQTLS
ncbi:Probable dual specificity protein kinase YAK1 homolog, partial [Durusdinium trenchii]